MSAEKPLLTAERLRQVLSYNPDTGVFIWRVTNSRRAVTGSVAGNLHKVDGRIYIGVDGRIYKAHRLAWLYVHGHWPPAGIDHRDGKPANNAIHNLRPANQAQNMQNLRRATKRSATGLLGASRHRNKFIAQISVLGQRTCLGTFNTAEEAHAAYMRAKAQLHPFSTTTEGNPSV